MEKEDAREERRHAGGCCARAMGGRQSPLLAARGERGWRRTGSRGFLTRSGVRFHLGGAWRALLPHGDLCSCWNTDRLSTDPVVPDLPLPRHLLGLVGGLSPVRIRSHASSHVRRITPSALAGELRASAGERPGQADRDRRRARARRLTLRRRVHYPPRPLPPRPA